MKNIVEEIGKMVKDLPLTEVQECNGLTAELYLTLRKAGSTNII